MCVFLYCADCDWSGQPSRCPKCGSKETRRDWDEANDYRDEATEVSQEEE
jgi:hypothetical protein